MRAVEHGAGVHAVRMHARRRRFTHLLLALALLAGLPASAAAAPETATAPKLSVWDGGRGAHH